MYVFGEGRSLVKVPDNGRKIDNNNMLESDK